MTLEGISNLTQLEELDVMKTLVHEIPDEIALLQHLKILNISVNDIKEFGSEAVIISQIPAASHCAFEGKLIGDIVKRELNIPVTAIEVPPLADAVMMTIMTKIDSLKEIVKIRH